MSSKDQSAAAGAPRELTDADLSGVAGGVDAFCGTVSHPRHGPFPPWTFPHRNPGPFPPRLHPIPHLPKLHGPIVIPL